MTSVDTSVGQLMVATENLKLKDKQGDKKNTSANASQLDFVKSRITSPARRSCRGNRPTFCPLAARAFGAGRTRAG